MGIVVPEVEKELTELYIAAVTVGNLAFTSVIGADMKGMEKFKEKLGKELSLEEVKHPVK